MFTQGAIGSGEQLGLQTETDRDILAKIGCDVDRSALRVPPDRF